MPAAMWNLQPLILLFILCTFSSATELRLCDQALGTNINAQDCMRALSTLPPTPLGPTARRNTRFFTTEASDPAYLLPQEASYGSCKIAIYIRAGSYERSSWRALTEWTEQLIHLCARRSAGLGGQFLINGFVIGMYGTHASTAAGAAAVLTPAALRQAANQLLSLSPPTGHDRLGLPPMRPPVPAVPPRQQASLHLLSQAAQLHGHGLPSTPLRYALAPPAGRAAILGASENVPGSFSFGPPAMRQNAGTTALYRAPAPPAVGPAVLGASGNVPGRLSLDPKAIQHQVQAPTLQQLLMLPVVRPFAPAVARHTPQGSGSIAEPIATPVEPPRWGSRKPRSPYDQMWPSSG